MPMGIVRVLDAEPPCKDTVRVLEEMLELAKDGKISSVAIASVERDGSIGTIWSQAPSLGCLAGAIARLQYRVLQSLDD